MQHELSAVKQRSGFTGRARWLVALAFTAAGIGAVPLEALAQTFPNKQIRVIVPYRQGGMSDVGPRMYAERIGTILGAQPIVEFKPGGNGIVGINDFLSQPADGHTWFMADTSHWAILPAIQPVPYDFMRDFAPVTALYTNALIFCTQAGAPFNDVREFVALAKAKPGAYNYISPGIGTVHHLMIEVLAAATGIKINHIPYNGGAETVAALLRGDGVFSVISGANVLPQVAAGKFKMLGITRAKRTDILPGQVPVANQLGIDYDFGGVQAMFVRAGTPRAIVDRLSQLAIQVGTQPDFIAKFREIGASDSAPSTPEAITEVLRNEIRVYGAAVKAANVKPQ